MDISDYTIQDHMYAAKFYESMGRAAQRLGKPDVATRAFNAAFKHRQMIDQVAKDRRNTK